MIDFWTDPSGQLNADVRLTWQGDPLGGSLPRKD
jgi:hypothetical protein